MAVILSIETSTSACSVALHERNKLIADHEEHVPQSAAARLTPMIDDLFRTTGLDKSDLKAVAVSAGPGSYTGLRIGIATAKGICYALDIPLITLDSLHVLAGAVEPRPEGSLLCPMIDARRMEVYTTLLTSSMTVIEGSHAHIVEKNSFSAHLERGPVMFFGTGAGKCRTVIRHPNAVFAAGYYPRAKAMIAQAFRKFETGDFADVRHFEPAYLKEFVAKTKKA